MKKDKLDRINRYNQLHLNARVALMHVMAATEKARLAEALHPSRQAAHLDVADAELKEAVRLLLDAAVALSPMRRFRSYEERQAAKEEVKGEAA